KTIYIWWGRVRGGLAIGTLLICALFAAMSGISGAAVVAIGTIALPEMLRHGYDKKLALGCINTGGSWGVLIPPSVLMIIYALIANESVGKMFVAGAFAGSIMVILVCLYVLLRAFLQPDLAPALNSREINISWQERFASLKSIIMPV